MARFSDRQRAGRGPGRPRALTLNQIDAGGHGRLVCVRETRSEAEAEAVATEGAMVRRLADTPGGKPNGQFAVVAV